MVAVRRKLHMLRQEGKYLDRRRKPLAQALAVIAEIPEQVREFLEQTANNVVSDMEEQLQEMRTVIQANENASNASQAVEQLDAIPDIVLNSFESSFAHANDMVQMQVGGVLAQLGDGDGKDELAFQASAIPEAVARIAEAELAAALQQSQQRAAAGIDAALRAAPAAAASVPLHLGQCKHSIVSAQLGHQLTSAQLQSRAQLAVNEAISIAPSMPAAMDLQRWGQPGAGLLSPLGPGPPNEPISFVPPAPPLLRLNAGSVGHPELCTRPCLYFARGLCAHGADCEYCHLEHSKRAAHLDKRNRETLKAARFEDVLVLTLPLLQDKVRRLGLSPDVLQLLDGMAFRLAALTDRTRIRKTRALQNLGNALGSLPLRSLLTTLGRLKDDHASPEHAQLEAYVTRIRALVMPGTSALDDM